MVHVYYHIYAIDGVESIIDEQIQLIQTYFDFPYKMNIGISISSDSISSKPILDKIYGYNNLNYKVRDIRCKGSEFVTLDLIQSDINDYNDSDYIFYLHTKGASKINWPNYKLLTDWRHIMNYFNIEKVKSVFKIFEKKMHNTYGINYVTSNNLPHYSGNFWWATAEYIKTIDYNKSRKEIRYDAETNYLQNGIDWKPFTPFNSEINHYNTEFPKEKYR